MLWSVLIAQGTGGPDAYGYRWYDADYGAPVNFSDHWTDLQPACYWPVWESNAQPDVMNWWIDPAAVGATPLSIADADDDKVSVSLPFDITYFGQTFTSGSNITVSTNGWIGFRDAASYTVSYSGNDEIPDPGTPNGGIIAPFWDDLVITDNTGANSTSELYAFYVGDLGTYWGSGWSGKQGFVVVWNYFKRFGNTFDAANPPRMEVVITDSMVNGNNVIVWIMMGNVNGAAGEYTTASQGFESPDSTYGCVYRGVMNGDEITPYVDNLSMGVAVFHYFGDPTVKTLGGRSSITYTLPLPFAVQFYGQTYDPTTDSLLVSNNGWAAIKQFAGTSSDYTNDGIPNSATPNALFAVLWDGLVVGNMWYKTVGTSPDRKFIIEWEYTFRYAGTDGPRVFNGNFQLQIHERTSATGDNVIVYCYNTTDFGSSDPDGAPLDATIGIEDQNGAVGLDYTGNYITGTSPNISAVADSTCVLFTTDVITSSRERVKGSPSYELTREGLRVSSENPVEITVYDVSGKVLLSRRISKGVVGLEHLPKGVYFVRVGEDIIKLVR